MPETEVDYEYDGDDDGIVAMTPGVLVPSAIGLTALVAVSVVGNAMTVAAYLKDRGLNTVYDFYIFNLGVADLLISCVSLPFYTVYTLMELTWPFGYAFCKIYLLFDFTLCFETIVLMLIMSLDRLLMITLGPMYAVQITKKVAIAQVCVSWVVSFLVYGPAIIGYNYWTGESIVEDRDCDTEFAYDLVFTTITAFIEFGLPFVCMTIINLLIFVKIRKRIAVGHAQKAVRVKPVAENGVDEARPTAIESTDSGKRQRKAAKFLAMLVVAFLVFWAPYTITTIIISFCEECVNASLYEFFNFVLWMKSTVNPFLYAYNSPRYRKHFKTFLTLNGRLFKAGRDPPANEDSTRVQTNVSVAWIINALKFTFMSNRALISPHVEWWKITVTVVMKTK